MTHPAKPGLCLSRKAGERVLIGDEIVVEVASVRGGAAVLRVVAPKNVRVDREEVRERIQQESPT